MKSCDNEQTNLKKNQCLSGIESHFRNSGSIMYIYKDQHIGTILFRGKCTPDILDMMKGKIVNYGTRNLPHMIVLIMCR